MELQLLRTLIPRPRDVTANLAAGVLLLLVVYVWNLLAPQGWPSSGTLLTYAAALAIGAALRAVLRPPSAAAANPVHTPPADLSPRIRSLVEWDTACARDWWTRQGLGIDLVAVHCVLEEVNESYALITIRLWNGLTDTYRIHDLRSANVFVEIEHDGETTKLALREPVRPDQVEVFRGQERTLVLRVPMADNVQSYLHMANLDRVPTRWTVEGNWQISAYDREPMALSRRLTIESLVTTAP